MGMNDPLATNEFEDFNQWWQELLKLSFDIEFHLVGTQEHYREYFDDGDTPSEALDAEIEAELMKGTDDE